MVKLVLVHHLNTSMSSLILAVPISGLFPPIVKMQYANPTTRALMRNVR